MRTFIIWIFNAVVAALCVISVVGYAFGPFWSLKATVSLDSTSIKPMLDSAMSDVASDIDINVDNILGGKELRFSITLVVPAKAVANAFGDADDAINAIVSQSIDPIIKQLTDSFYDISKGLIKEATSAIAKKEVKDNMKKILENMSDSELETKLKNAGLDDEYISKKTDEIINSIYSGDCTKDQISDLIVNEVDDFYKKLVDSSDEDFDNIMLSDEDKENIRSAISDVLDQIADEDGKINPDEFLDNLILQALNSLDGESNDKYEQKRTSVLLVADSSDKMSEQFKEWISDELFGYIENSGISEYVGYVMMAMLGLFLLSSLAWVYILIKLLFKLIFRGEPTVKLKAPIILGWLPFLILVLVPSIAVKFLLPSLLSGADLPFKGLSFGFWSTGGIISFVSAVICFGISIFYIVMRSIKKHAEKNKEEE